MAAAGSTEEYLIHFKSNYLNDLEIVEVKKEDVVPVYEKINRAIIRQTFFVRIDDFMLENRYFSNARELQDLPASLPGCFPGFGILQNAVYIEFGCTYLPKSG